MRSRATRERGAVPFLDLSRQMEDLRGQLQAAFEEVLAAGHFVLGERGDRFEREFARDVGAAECIGVASGTDALALALRAAGVGIGDEVIIPAFTCVPTAAAIRSIGAVPRLADVDLETMTLAPTALEQLVTPRTRAVVPVHLYGQCSDMSPIVDLARAERLVVIEDAAQAHRAEYAGRRAGTLADAAAFSFYPTKNLGALGDAGAVVTDDAGLAERVRLLRAQGEDPERGAIEAVTHSRLDELQAAILSVKLPRLGDWSARRRAIARYYIDELDRTELALPFEASRRRHAYHLFVVRSRSRDRFREQLAARGVGTAIHYPRAVHQHPAYAGVDAPFPVEHSERLAAEVVSLPLYPELSDAEVELVAAAARECAPGSATL